MLWQWKKKFPDVDFFFGGEDEDTQEGLNSLARAFALAVLGIFFLLILIFQNIMQPFLVMVTIPLGISSVIFTFFLHGLPLSFMAMLGIVALAGVIVNNAIVFVDFVNRARLDGFDRYESIFQAAKQRVRPIFLTTITTVFGLMPTAYGIGGLDKFIVPIALAMGWGLVIGSILTVFVFPAAISILDDFSEWIARKLPKKS
jgi:multidrug efflux pump subunit AcrB